MRQSPESFSSKDRQARRLSRVISPPPVKPECLSWKALPPKVCGAQPRTLKATSIRRASQDGNSNTRTPCARFPRPIQDRFASAAGATDRLNELTTRREMAVEPLQGAAQSLSREVMGADGVLDPQKFARWQTKYRDVIDQLPSGVRAQLSTAQGASEAIGRAAESRSQAINAYQKSAAGKFLGVSDPEDVTKTVSRIFGAKTPVRDMQDLAKKVAGNPDAREGLRKAVADVILAKAKSTTEAGASGVENLNASHVSEISPRQSPRHKGGRVLRSRIRLNASDRAGHAARTAYFTSDAPSRPIEHRAGHHQSNRSRKRRPSGFASEQNCHRRRNRVGNRRTSRRHAGSRRRGWATRYRRHAERRPSESQRSGQGCDAEP